MRIMRWMTILLTGLIVAEPIGAQRHAPTETLLLSKLVAEPLPLRPRPATPSETLPPPKVPPKDSGLAGTLLALPIRFHQAVISPQDSSPCTFTPSCSTYALQALQKSAWLGWIQASDRLLRCHLGNENDYPMTNRFKFDPLRPDESMPLDASKAALGGLLSLVPGMGQLTAGKTSDGLYALSVIGVLGLGSWYYARQDETVKAGIVGSVGGFFYIGNLYGGAVAWGREHHDMP